ncbi:MAG: S24/S26 family peptidase [Bacteroidaceae bacterium]|nr:S24/S26 family peptidase [Bacteroidaceae bacterium]
MRKLDTDAYISTLRDLVNQGKEVRLIISGSSMTPFLVHERDSILFSKPDSPLKRGDMVFYQRENGQFVMHRILHVKPEGLYIIGDAQVEIEGPVNPSCVFARITKINRKGKWIGPGQFWWWFFQHIWLSIIPLRPYIIKLLSLIK